MQPEKDHWLSTFWKRLFNPQDAMVVNWLILLNVVIFLGGWYFQVELPRNLYPPGRLDIIQFYGSYSAYTCFYEGEWWRLLTYQFLHANMGHLLFNMIALWFFGPVVEERFGHLRFLLYYLFCGVAAALFSTLLGDMGCFDAEWLWVPMVGASGSIYGIMAACAVLFPYARVQLLFPPVNMSVRQFALVILGIAVAVIIFQWDNAGGEAGHLGGMLAGFILTLLIVWKEKLLPSKGAAAASADHHVKHHSNHDYPTQEEVEAIMKKISQSGLESLTEEERNTLMRASRRWV